MRALRTRLKAVVLVSTCAWGLAGSNTCSLPVAQAEEPPSDGPDDQACSVVASIPYWDQTRAIKSFEENVDLVNYISVFWYNLRSDGTIKKYKRARESRELIAFAHKHGVKVLALVANLPDEEQDGVGGNWDPARVGDIIRSPQRRAAHIADLMALTHRMGFDGIHIDYEALLRAHRGDFTLFIQELGAALHAENKLLSVALHPKTSEHNPRESNGSQAQDWDALHPHVDQLHFMTYGEHTAGTAPGPVASLGWVERVLRYAVNNRKVPRAKTFMGVPLYAEEWRMLEPGRFHGLDIDFTFDYAHTRKRKHHGTEMWSSEYQSPSIEYVAKDGQTHILWFENQQSSEPKLVLGARLGVCNVALWRLGGEDPGIWQLLRDSRHVGRAGHIDVVGLIDHRKLIPEPESADDDGADDDGADDDGADDDGSDNNDDDDDGDEADLVWRLSGRGSDSYPRLTGELGTEIETYEKFSSTAPDNERDNWLSNIDLEQAFHMTPNLAVTSDVRVVLKSDGGHEHFYTDFPFAGIYVRELWLRYETAHYSFVAGKYEPAAAIRGYAPIFFGNYSTDLNLEGRLGAGASFTLERDAIGRHTLTGHSFYRDTWALSGELLTGRPRDKSAAIGHAGWPPDYLVTLHGGTDDIGVVFNYTLGTGLQRQPALLDERVYLGALYGMVPLGAHGDLELSMDVLYLRNAGGEPEDKSSLLLGVAYSGSEYSIGVGYSLRFVEPGTEPDGEPEDREAGRMDRIAEIVARYDIGRFVSVEAAYQTVREGDEREHAFGIALKGMIDLMVY